jgi:hypothetical protein
MLARLRLRSGHKWLKMSTVVGGSAKQSQRSGSSHSDIDQQTNVVTNKEQITVNERRLRCMGETLACGRIQLYLDVRREAWLDLDEVPT